MSAKLKRGELPDCCCKALKQSEVVIPKDPVTTCRECPLAQKYHGRGAMTVRLENKKRVYGILSVSIPVYLTSDEEELSLFKEIA